MKKILQTSGKIVNGPERLANCSMVVEEIDGGYEVTSSATMNHYDIGSKDWLKNWSIEKPDEVLFAERTNERNWDRRSYREVQAEVSRLANTEPVSSLQKGDCCLIISRNKIACACLMLAISERDGVSCVISENHIYNSEFGFLRLPQILRLSKPLLIVINNEKEIPRKVFQFLHEWGYLLWRNKKKSYGVESDLLYFVLEHSRSFQKESYMDRDPGGRLFFTSGTTGPPKAVLCTHEMLSVQQAMMSSVWKFLRLDPPILVDWMPWTHTSGGVNSLNMVLANGGTLYIDDGRPNLTHFWKTVQNLSEVSPTWYTNVPLGYAFLLDELDRNGKLKDSFLSRLDMIVYGGAAINQSLWQRLKKLTLQKDTGEICLSCGWGSTETTSTLCVVHDLDAVHSEVGTPLPGVSLKLIGDSAPYRAFAKGPHVFERYHGATAKAVDEGGYYDTGDLVDFVNRQDGARGLRFVGRHAENFKLSSGEFVRTNKLQRDLLAILDGVCNQVLLAGPDRDYLVCLLWLKPNVDLSDARSLVANQVRVWNETERRSLEIKRVTIIDRPPSLELGEVTEKGTLNQLMCFNTFKDVIEDLYSEKHFSNKVIYLDD